MVNVTLIGERWAKEGNEFTYLGPCSECKDCKVKTVCFNLEEGRRYRITRTRETKHPCKIHDLGVVAVELQELPLQVAMETGKALEGAVVTFGENGCRIAACVNKRLCSQERIKKDQKVKILQKGEELECPEGKRLVVVEVQEAT